MTIERELLEKFHTAKSTLEKCKQAKDAAQEEFDKAEKILIDHLESIGAQATAKYDGLGYASMPKPRLYASVLKEKEQEAFDWLRQKGMEVLIKEAVNSQSLSSYLADLIEQGETVPEFFSMYMKQTVRMYNSN